MRTILTLLAIGAGVASLLAAAYMGTHPAARLGLQSQHLLSAAAWAVGGVTAAGLLGAAAAVLGLLRQIRDQAARPTQPTREQPSRPAAPAFGTAPSAQEAAPGPRLRVPVAPAVEPEGDADAALPKAARPLPRL